MVSLRIVPGKEKVRPALLLRQPDSMMVWFRC